MLPVFDVTTTTEFIHPDDKSEPKTIFTIGVIDAKADAWIKNQYTQLGWVKTQDVDTSGKPVMQPSINVNRAEKHVELCKLGVKGVKNFNTQLSFVDEQYPFGKRTVLDERSLNAIKPYIDGLANAIENNTSVTPDDEKK